MVCGSSNVALLGIAFNLIVLVAAPLARPDLDLLQKALSYYARGPWGLLQVAAFAAMGLASIALSVAILRAANRSFWLLLVVPMLILGGLGGLGLVVFPMGEPAPSTIIGDAHQTAGTIGGVAQLVAALAFALAIRSDPTWRKRYPVVMVAFVLAVVGAIATQLAIWRPDLGIPMGATMRLTVVPIVLIWGLVALRLRGRCVRAATRSAAAR